MSSERSQSLKNSPLGAIHATWPLKSSLLFDLPLDRERRGVHRE